MIENVRAGKPAREGIKLRDYSAEGREEKKEAPKKKERVPRAPRPRTVRTQSVSERFS
jgi:hypothetical protein